MFETSRPMWGQALAKKAEFNNHDSFDEIPNVQHAARSRISNAATALHHLNATSS
jgi:hypothetical protein